VLLKFKNLWYNFLLLFLIKFMANSAGSRKRARQAIKRNRHNSMLRSRMRTMIKKVSYAIDDSNKDEASANFANMQKALDSAVSKGLITKNLAARKKARLNAKIKAL
jgi:small subunit ribosomal protein S20